VIKKEDEQILKCKDLIIEIKSTWNVKAKVIKHCWKNWNYPIIFQTIPEQHTGKA